MKSVQPHYRVLIYFVNYLILTKDEPDVEESPVASSIA